MPTCGSPDDPTRPDMGFAYEDESRGGHNLQGLNRLAANHPIKAIIIGMAINIAMATGVGLAAGAISKITNFPAGQSTKVEK